MALLNLGGRNRGNTSFIVIETYIVSWRLRRIRETLDAF